MAGAAAEAVLLELAAAKTGKRDDVEAELRTSKGRQRLTDRLKSQRNTFEQRAFDQFIDLVSYYRDDAAHGVSAPIDEDAAHLCLTTLLRLARLATDRWAVLTT